MSRRNPGSWQPGREQRLLERLIFGHRRKLLWLFALATLFFGYQASRLQPDASFEKMIPMQHPYIQAMMRHIADLGAAGTTIRIAVENTRGDIFDNDYLQTLQKVNDAVFYLPGVDRNRMRSLWTANVRWIAVTEQGFEGDRVIDSSFDGSPAAMERLRLNILRSGEIGRLVANDFRSSVVEAPLFDRDPKTGAGLDYRALSHKLDEIRARYSNDHIRIHITGFAKMIGDLLDGITDIFVFAVITFAITAVLLLAYSRSITGTLAPLLCSVIAVVWQLGLLTTFGYGLNAYSILVPFLVFAIGVSHGVQVINAASLEMADGADSLTAARRAFRQLYVPGMTALVSDAIGFVTLLLINIQVIRDLGVAAGIGVAVIIVTNLVLLPIVISYLGIGERARRYARRRREQPLALWRWLAACASPKVAPASVIIGLLGFAIGLAGGQHLKIGDLDPGAPELKPDSRYNRDVSFMNAHYATSSDVMVVMVEMPKEACSNYPNVEAIDRFVWRMDNVEGVESAAALSTVSRLVLAGYNEGSLKWATITRDQRALDSTFSMVPPQLMNRDCSLAPVALFLTDHRADTLQRVVSAVKTFAAANDTPHLHFTLAAGNAGIEAATNEVIENAQLKMLAMVYGVVCALVFVSFGSWRAVACIVPPLMLTSALCQALMAWLGIGVKVATLPVITLGVGIGVDYGIYIFSRLRHFLDRGMALPAAYAATLASTGKAVSFTGMALAIGVGTWMFSPIKFQADMGKLLTFMFLWNMVGALWLLPALAHYLVRPRAPAKQTETGA